MATRFALVTDCEMLRKGFEAMADADPELDLLGYAINVAEALLLLEASRPDVMIIDFGLDDDAALPLCKMISHQYPDLPVLILSPVLTDEGVHGAIEAGARGFVYKDLPQDSLKQTIHRLSTGESILDPKVTARVMAWATQGPLAINVDGLSLRERDVVRGVALGEPNKQIARRLGVTENTVKTYLRRAYRKLDIQSRSAAAAVAAKRGLL
jgi:DNA-binding NarL/FixJ family response regulator